MNLSSDYIVQVMRNIHSSTNQTGTHITNVMTMDFTNVMTKVFTKVMTLASLKCYKFAEMSGVVVWQAGEH